MRWLVSAVSLWVSAHSLAGSQIGMGHMVREGVSYSASKGFYVAMINDSNRLQTLNVSALRADLKTVAGDVRLHSKTIKIGARRTIRMLVVITDLSPSESKTRYICISEKNHEQARICTRLIAHRRVVD